MYARPWRRRARHGSFSRVGLPIDTLEYAKLLRQAGFSARQAEGQAQALAATMTDSIATKQDIAELGGRVDLLGLQIDEVEARFELRLRELEERIEVRLREFERRLEVRMSELEKRVDAKMDARFADLERRLTVRMGVIMTAGIGLMVTLDRLL